MRDETEIMRDIQRAIREQLDRRGIDLKVVAARSGLPYSTVCSYFPGNERGSTPKVPAQLSAGAVRSLCGAIPDDLLNLLAPEGYAIVRVPVGVDFDDISRRCRTFLDCKEEFHHPDSEAGRDLGPTETATLATNVVALKVA